jgi:hypothetical protein
LIAAKEAALSAQLVSLDTAAAAKQQALLGHETEALLTRERQLAAAAVPTSGTIGPIALANTGMPRPPTGLTAATAHLEDQRARWLRGVYDDTQAAAEDAARQRGWIVTFGPSHRGEPNRTTQLAALLANRIWTS